MSNTREKVDTKTVPLELIDAEKQALHALWAFASLSIFFHDDVGLSVGPLFVRPEANTALRADWFQLSNRACGWSADTIVDLGWGMGDTEAFHDEIAFDTLARAQAIVTSESLPVPAVEAFYLSALVRIIDNFSAIWDTLGGSLNESPLPILSNVVTICLREDYGLNLLAPGPEWRAVLEAASELAVLWNRWASEPHPLLEYTFR